MEKIALCLDFDCTIVDSFQRGLNYLEEIVLGLGLPFTPEMKVKIIANWTKRPIDLIKLMWPEADCEYINERWHEDAGTILDFVPGGYDALIHLNEKYYLSILTSRNRASLLRHIDSYKYLFRFIIAGDDIQYHKPDKRSMETVIYNYWLMGVRKEEIVYVGDGPNADWPPARDCGVEFYGVTTGPFKRDDFLAAGLDESHILNSIADLPKVLLNQNAS